jgi:large subunit ribosomal protein L25
MDIGKLEAEVRSRSGKGWARKLRQTGRIPAVCYGPGAEPISLAVDPRALKLALDPEKRHNTLIALTLTGDGANLVLTVMLKDFQTDAFKKEILHADFVRVDVSKPVKVTIPVILTGKPEGVKVGGILHQVYRHVEVECLPDRIPVKLEADVSALNIGQALHVSDLGLREGVRVLLDAKLSIAVVVAPKADKTADEEAAEAAAAAEGVEGAVPAAPAEGAAAGAPGKGAAAGAPGKGAAAGVPGKPEKPEDKKAAAKMAARVQAKSDKVSDK